MPSPILSVDQMRAWEQAAWKSGKISEREVIARVGQLVAERALKMTADGDRILLLAGKGHNGDDVRMAVPHLNARAIEILNVNHPAKQLAELIDALDRRPDLIIDGLFGIGLNRPLDSDWRALIDRVNQSAVPVLAVDSPSGLNCVSGAPEGTAIRAELTLTLGAVKTGLIAITASEFVGELELAEDIGLISCPVESDLQWTRAHDFDGFPPVRRRDSHKGSFGHLVIMAGSLGYHGAAVLAARGAQAGRPGLLSVVTTDEAYLPVASQLRSAMVRPWASEWEPPDRTTAVLFGPGLADPAIPAGMRKVAVHLWQDFGGAVIVDASGLDWLPEGKCKSKGPRLITPHPGEAARLLNVSSGDVQADRVAGLRRLSKRFGGILVVLKGHQTLVGADVGNVYVNHTGGPMLGQGGSGDVLAGFLGGLLAQPALAGDPLKTVRYAVWRHGLAGESEGWSALIDDLPVVLAGPLPMKSG